MSSVCLKIILFVFCIATTYGQFSGEDCRTTSGKPGKCVLLSRCPAAQEAIKQNRRPQICSFQGREPIVCCSQSSSQNSGGKSKEKCREYANTEVFTPPGIVGGFPAEAKEYPHMVALGFDSQDGIKWECGGSLISDQYILTAAHCVNSREYGRVKWARLGTINLQNPSQGGDYQEYPIANAVTHTDYKPPQQYHDIALLKLENPVRITEYVKPACINSEFNVRDTPVATGWGRVEFTGETSNNLLEVPLEFYNNDVCKKSYLNIPKRKLPNGIVESTQICAGGAKDQQKDTCQGDSGGPLQIRRTDANFPYHSIVGITSFGKACGIANTPAVYTRVSNYVSWIENIVWP